MARTKPTASGTVRSWSGQDQRVVAGRVGVTDGPVHREHVRLIEVIEGLRLAWLGREQLGRPTGVLYRLPGFGELDLLRALIGDHECDSPALKFVRHDMAPLVWQSSVLRPYGAASGMRYQVGAAANKVRQRAAPIRPVLAKVAAG
jgi:hypothetical protein